MFIKELYCIYKRLTLKNRVAKNAILDKDSYYGHNFNIDLRDAVPNRKYIEIGKHCIIEGSFIFETKEGHVKIGNRVHIGNSMFISRNSITIEDDVTIAWDCLFYDHNSHSINWSERSNDTEQEYYDVKSGHSSIFHKNWDVVVSKPIYICKKAWIGVGCKVLKGVTIGEGAIIGAGSIVTKDVEAWTMVCGNPASFVKHLPRS